MDTVILKAKEPFSFTRRTRIIHPDSHKVYYDMKKYDFNFDNSFKTAVPLEVWEDLKNEYVDRKWGIQYKHILRAL